MSFIDFADETKSPWGGAKANQNWRAQPCPEEGACNQNRVALARDG
jgi:hypothetical protein